MLIAWGYCKGKIQIFIVSPPKLRTLNRFSLLFSVDCDELEMQLIQQYAFGYSQEISGIKILYMSKSTNTTMKILQALLWLKK